MAVSNETNSGVKPNSVDAYALETGLTHVAVELADHVDRHALGAYSGAFTNVGAATEALRIMLVEHVDYADVALRLALRQ